VLPADGLGCLESFVRTVETYLTARQNLRAAARLLGIGVRTVSYRLVRVEELIGRPLAGEVILRLSTALFVRRLLEPDARVANRFDPVVRILRADDAGGPPGGPLRLSMEPRSW
jgi:DNA-binding transcriptional LysR family regulator